MTPQERDLVTQLLQRLKAAGGEPKDPDAEQLIRRAMGEQPDAPYYLVQTVLMQDMALAEAQRRITELESRSQAAAPRQRSFLGGGSVPSSGPWAQGAQQGAQPPVWGSQPAQPPMQSPMGSMMQPSASSGFLRSAAATAAGIAGGALLFQGIQSMFGHGFGSAYAQPGISESVTNNYWNADPQASEQTASDDPAADDPSAPDPSWDQGGMNDPGADVAADDWSGGDDFGGGDDVI